MADISQIKLPSGDTFDIIDEKSGYITAQYIENKTDYSIPVSRVGEIVVGETAIGTDSTNFPTSKAVVDYTDERIAQEIDAIDVGVTSVNGKTGSVTLSASDVGAVTTEYLNNKLDDFKGYMQGQIPLNSNNVLWSGGTGGYYMSDTQSVNLSQNITDQMIGIVLVWSPYDSSAGAHDRDWNFTFVPKWFVQNYNGKGMECILTNTIISSTMSYKYVYIYNNKIVGYKNNTATGTGYANNAFVLRAVIGI